jgi:hypothetical protein
MGQSKIPITTKEDGTLMFPSCSHQVSKVIPMDTLEEEFPPTEVLSKLIVAKKKASHFIPFPLPKILPMLPYIAKPKGKAMYIISL